MASNGVVSPRTRLLNRLGPNRWRPRLGLAAATDPWRRGTLRRSIRFLIVFVFVMPVWLSGSTHADGVVRLRGVHYLGDLPTLVAEQHGLFTKHGVDLDIDYGVSGKTNLKALRAGDVDFALMALTPLVIDRLQDTKEGAPDDPVILANLAHSIRLDHVVLLGTDTNDPKSALSGQRIGLMKGTNAEFTWSLFAARHGLGEAGVEIIDMTPDAIPDALAAGEISGAVVWQPWTNRLRARFGDRLRVLPSSRVYTAKWVVVTRRRVVQQQPSLARRVLAAYDAAILRIHQAPEKALALYYDRAGIDRPGPDTVRSLIYELSLDWAVLSSLLEQAAWARRAGYGSDGLDPLKMLDPGPLASVSPASVHIPRPSNGEARSER